MDQSQWDLSDRQSTRGINDARIANRRYRFGELLGRGGMGEVIDARDDQIGREVAIKRLRAESPNEKQIARFMREARIQGRLEHPAIVPVHELARGDDGKPYFAMKKLAGTTLSQILREPDPVKYPRQKLLRALSDVCLAVELAHTRGFVHRDLKPENIMLGDFGETYVLDWGVAKVTGERDDDELASVDGGDEGPVTAVGALVGTPGYMSPEQVRGDQEIDGRADVYSLGSILFEILAGTRLHPPGTAAMKTTIEGGIEVTPSVRAPDADIPPELDRICVHALQIDREERMATARELGERIQKFLDGDRDLAHRRTLAQQHFSAASAAFAADERSRAMREAGRALALDPTLHEALDLITRMMIQPPKVLPPEVRRSFDSESAKVVRRTATVAAFASGAYILFAPLLAVFGDAPPAQLAVMITLAAMSAASLWWMRKPGRAFIAAPVIALHISLIVLINRMFSPFLIAPGLAAVTAIGVMTGPQYRKRQATFIWLAACLAVVGPWVAEMLGYLDKTIEVFDGGLVIHSDIIQASATFWVLMVLYSVMLIGAAVLLTRGMRVAERNARKQMHVQAWQLRQLVSPG